MVLLASCESEITAPEVVVTPENGVYALRIGIPETKTTLGELDGNKRKVYWSDGDQIAVNGIASNPLSGLAANSTVAEFTFATAQTAPYSILYPASIWRDETSVILPSVQDFVTGSFADGACPMAAYSADGQNLSLKYLCAVVKVPLKLSEEANADTDKIDNIVFKSNGSELMSGDFTIDYSNASLEGISGSTSITMSIKRTLLSTATDVYFVVPAGTYASGFSVVITDVNDHYMTVSADRSLTLEAGHIYNMSELAFQPDAQDVIVNISNANDLITLANNYNNGYYNNANLIVNLTSNITFNATTSATFSATGGIGTKGEIDNYFHGSFNGNNKTISGYTGSAPLFAAIGSSGAVSDLTIDNTCSFTFTHPNTADAFFGPVTNYNKGIIDNVKVNATVALAEVADVVEMTSLGGIVGRNTVGTIKNSTFAGAIDAPAGFASAKKLLIGGIVGYTSNDTGLISNCTLDGTISVAAQITSTDRSNPCLAVGGIVGYNRATVTECITKPNSTVATGFNTETGTIVIKSELTYYNAVGGIIGENEQGEISSCTNGADIFNKIFKLNAADASARYIKAGGIVGKNNASGIISDCTNNASVQHRSNPRIQSLAGIAGYNAGTVTACTNTGAVKHMTTGITGTTKKGGRIINIAGVIGENLETGVVSNVHNTADLEISAMESNYDNDNDKPVCEPRMGGVIAYNLAEIDGGAAKNITNTGKVYCNCYLDKPCIGMELGGVVAYSTASVRNVKNSGYVLFNWNSDAYAATRAYIGGVVGMMAGDGEISGCVNEGGDSNAGEVNLAVKKGSAKHTENVAGGIVGYSANAIAISNCTNSGYVHGGNATKQNGTSCYVGGIAGWLDGALSISDCTNSGSIYNDHFSNSTSTNNTAFNGGIAGWISGTAEAPALVSGCEHNTTALSPRRGYSGGIAGYANYVSMIGNNVKGTGFAGSAYYVGGVAGWAVNSTIENCNVTATSISTSQVQMAGGIVAKLGAASTLEGCRSSISSITGPTSAADGVTYSYGALAGESVEGSTIQNCHYPGSGTINAIGTSFSWKICGDSKFTDGGGNVADL